MAVLFDLDGTLYDIVAPMREALRRIAPPEIRPTIEERFWRCYFAMERSFPTDVNLFMGELLEAAVGGRGWKDRGGELLELFLSNIQLFEGVQSLLDRLASSGTKLGVVTNGPLVFQLAKIKRLGLEPWFERGNVITPEIAGAAKPSPIIFEHACQLLGVRSEGSIFVGDNPLTDLGALDAGMDVVLIHPDLSDTTTKSDHSPGAVYRVPSFREAARTITSLVIPCGREGADRCDT